MKVAVLGCGPAGLMAAHGAVMSLFEHPYREDMHVRIFSRKRKSPLYGAQYLHAPIPAHTQALPVMVDYRLDGSADDYRQKVYGRMWDGTVSPEDLAEPHRAWDIRQTYDSLWESYRHIVEDTWIDPMTVRKIIDGGWDIVINSVPRDQLCFKGHAFGATEITAAGDAPDLGIRIPYNCPDNTVICNGNDNPSWYRLSNVFGHKTVEWPSSIAKVPVTTAAAVRKPTYTECDCWADKLHHVGRYGRWEKGVLSHTAYTDAYNIVKEALDRVPGMS